MPGSDKQYCRQSIPLQYLIIYAYYLSTNRGRFGCVYCADSVRIAS